MGECVPFSLEKTLSAQLSSSESNPESLMVFDLLICPFAMGDGVPWSTSLMLYLRASASSRRASFSRASSSTRFIIASSCSPSLTDMSSNCNFRCFVRVSAPCVSSASVSFSAVISQSAVLRSLQAFCSFVKRLSACCCMFLKVGEEVGSDDTSGKAVLMSRLKSSS